MKTKARCKKCKKEFEYYTTEQSGKYCSRKCWVREAVKNLGKRFTGRKHKPETIAKMKKAQIGRKHWHWVGAKVNYQSLHAWIERHKGKPKKCEHCGTTSKKAKYDWANKSGKYKRDLNDFIRLCKPCHRKFDAKR